MDEYNYIKSNNINVDLNNIKYITGPISVSLLKSNANTCITFGDYHLCSSNGFDVNEDSLYVTEYLESLFRLHSDKQFDLIIELPYYRTKYHDPNEIECTYMNNVYIQFEEYFKGNDSINNVRFHTSSISNLHKDENYTPVNKDEDFMKLLLMIEQYRYYQIPSVSDKIINVANDEQSLQEKYRVYLGSISIILGYLFDINKSGNGSFGNKILQIVYKYEKFRKYYKEVKNINKINTFILTQLNNTYDLYNIFDDYERLISKIGNINRVEIISFNTKVNNFVLKLSADILNYYMLVRFSKCLEYGTDVIIFIAGENHIEALECFITFTQGYNYLYSNGSYIVSLSEYNLLHSLVNDIIIKHKIKSEIFNKNVKCTNDNILNIIKKYKKLSENRHHFNVFKHMYRNAINFNDEHLRDVFLSGHRNAYVKIGNNIIL